MDSAEDNFLEKKAKGDQEPLTHCCRTAPSWESGPVHKQGDSCTRNRVSKDWNDGKEELGGREGGV